MYHSQHRPKSNRISQLFRCDFPAMRLHGGFDDGQANSDSLHRARVRFIHGTFTPRVVLTRPYPLLVTLLTLELWL